MSNFKFADLFAGLGGFHIGLSSLGGEVVFAAEWVPELQALYELNFGLAPYGDINNLNTQLVPDHDVLTAGFPCQPFSKAGEQLGFSDTTQGHLFFAVRDVLRAKRPAAFLLENVPNLIAHDGGRTWSTIKAELEHLGYWVDQRRYSPHNFGVPQVRERVYIVGLQANAHKFVWPEPQAVPTNIRTILDVEPVEGRRLAGSPALAFNAWQAFLEACPADVKLPSFPLWSMEWGAAYPYHGETPYAYAKANGVEALKLRGGAFGQALTGRGLDQLIAQLPSHARSKSPAFPSWKERFIRENRAFYAANNEWIDPWLKNVWNLPASLQKFEWNAQGAERNLRAHVLQLRASGLRVKRSTTAPALVAMSDTQVPIIGWESRFMTTAECARLQSLGDIILPQQRSSAYKALGNAVNAEVVRNIASALIGTFVADLELLAGEPPRDPLGQPVHTL